MNKPLLENEIMKADMNVKPLDPVLHFTPSEQNSRLLRNALGKFGSGVTLVTARTEQGPIGMTANSFASVSLDPALVLWSASRASGRFDAFANAQHYTIHVLAHDQFEIANSFARQADCFELTDWQSDDNGVPLIEGSLARFQCQQYAVHDGGDHAIIVGQILQVSVKEGEPMIFNCGRFGRFLENQ